MRRGEAEVHGKTVDRSNWRLVGPMHCAETKEQAIADVQYGIEHWFRYFQAVAAFLHALREVGVGVLLYLRFLHEGVVLIDHRIQQL